MPRRVLMTTLVDCGQNVRPFLDGPEVRACDIELVRREFYRQYPGKRDRTGKRLMPDAKPLADPLRDNNGARPCSHTREVERRPTYLARGAGSGAMTNTIEEERTRERDRTGHT